MIETVNGIANTTLTLVFLKVDVKTAGITHAYYYPITVGPSHVSLVAQSVRLYADPGSNVDWTASAAPGGPAPEDITVT